MRTARTYTAIAVGFVSALALARTAYAEPTACKSAILKASAEYVRIYAKALQQCRQKVIKGKLPSGTICEVHPAIAAVEEKALQRMRSKIAKKCGGRDKQCGTADDDTLASVGWDIGTCPTFRGANCANAITSCDDIPFCLACIGTAAARHATALYTSVGPSDPKVDKALNRCQVTIGQQAVKFFRARVKALATCWRAVNGDDVSGPCPDPGDDAALEAIDKARGKMIDKICRVCGGRDKRCGGGDDLTPAEIGFPGVCTGAGSLARFTVCAEVVTSLSGLTECVRCVTERDVDCTDRSAIPALDTYPTQCRSSACGSGVLNFSLPPVFGSTALTSGFVPDPFTVGITSGGPVNVSYLGGGCTGFATSAPSFSVNYTSGAFPVLRFYFTGSGDTTMIINSPSGSFFCVDDSFGTLNPTIDFNSPSSGRYDVWIASFSCGTQIGGTLHVTENTGNHP